MAKRVDYITYDTKGIWRCYEIKVSKSDFHSNAHNTFCGHYNYYVMTSELYEQVKNEIPNHVGVYTAGLVVKRAKKQELGVEEQILKDSMIRSLSREFDKSIQSNNTSYLNNLKRDVSRLERERSNYRSKYNDLYSAIYMKLGREWMRDNI